MALKSLEVEEMLVTVRKYMSLEKKFQVGDKIIAQRRVWMLHLDGLLSLLYFYIYYCGQILTEKIITEAK